MLFRSVGPSVKQMLMQVRAFTFCSNLAVATDLLLRLFGIHVAWLQLTALTMLGVTFVIYHLYLGRGFRPWNRSALVANLLQHSAIPLAYWVYFVSVSDGAPLQTKDLLLSQVSPLLWLLGILALERSGRSSGYFFLSLQQNSALSVGRNVALVLLLNASLVVVAVLISGVRT